MTTTISPNTPRFGSLEGFRFRTGITAAIAFVLVAPAWLPGAWSCVDAGPRRGWLGSPRSRRAA